jgi:hypothetical protein
VSFKRDILHLYSGARSVDEKGVTMKRFLLPVIVILLSHTVFPQECSNDESGPFCQTKAAVLRILSYPAYTGIDEKVLNRAGDMAALAVIESVPIEDLDSPEKARQILLILNLAFAAPQLITSNTDRRPTAALLLLDHLSRTNYGREDVNEIENVRNEIQHNTSTGHPFELVTLGDAPPLDLEHTQWLGSVLRWTNDVKPGMTRKDLLRVYTEQGGLSTRTQQSYALKGCPYIQVDVEFAPIGNEKDSLAKKPNDKILRISKPYLEYAHAD